MGGSGRPRVLPECPSDQPTTRLQIPQIFRSQKVISLCHKDINNLIFNLSRMSILEIGSYAYSPLDIIGKGFSSMVYKGVDKTTGYPVVIKVVDTSKKNAVEHALLNNQLRALQLMDHPFVIQTFAVRKNGNYVYIVCQSCEGDLMKDIKQSGSYTENEALDTLTFLAYAVNYIHSLGILHRDLKPSNILLKGDGTVRVADFGFCQFYRERTQAPNRYNVGSPLYMSPEAYKYTSYSTKSDCWAIGVIFYEMLIGQTPFKGMTYEIMLQNIENGYLIGNLEVSQFSKHILYRLLQTDPNKRWDTQQLLEILNKRNAQYQYAYQSGYPVNSGYYQQSNESRCCCC